MRLTRRALTPKRAVILRQNVRLMSGTITKSMNKRMLFRASAAKQTPLQNKRLNSETRYALNRRTAQVRLVVAQRTYTVGAIIDPPS
jgi:hypothetical protein